MASEPLSKSLRNTIITTTVLGAFGGLGLLLFPKGWAEAWTWVATISWSAISALGHSVPTPVWLLVALSLNVLISIGVGCREWFDSRTPANNETQPNRIKSYLGVDWGWSLVGSTVDYIQSYCPDCHLIVYVRQTGYDRDGKSFCGCSCEDCGWKSDRLNFESVEQLHNFISRKIVRDLNGKTKSEDQS